MSERDLDLLVAEKVFGLKIHATDWPCGREPECGCYEADLPPESDDNWQASWFTERGPVYAKSHAPLIVEPIPFYSTEIKAAWTVVDKLAPLAGSYRAGDGWFKLLYGESADHGEGDDKPCSTEPIFQEGEDGEDGEDPEPWSAHFHIGVMGDGFDYPAGWDHEMLFCARGANPMQAICRAAVKACSLEAAQ